VPSQGSTQSNLRYRLSEAQVADYERDGALYLPSVADQGWVARCRAGIERALSDGSRKVNSLGKYFGQLRCWETDADLRAFCTQSPISEIAAQLMRSDKVNLFYDQAFVKEQANSQPTPWHNDLPYWPVRGTQIITLWIALDDVTLANGGLEFIRGSHKMCKRYRPYYVDDAGQLTEPFDSGDEFEDMPDFEASRAQHDILAWDMAPGDALAFHAFTVHGARATSGTNRRRGYAVRMTGRDVRYFDGKVANAEIVNPLLKSGDVLDSAQYPVLYASSS